MPPLFEVAGVVRWGAAVALCLGLVGALGYVLGWHERDLRAEEDGTAQERQRG